MKETHMVRNNKSVLDIHKTIIEWLKIDDNFAFINGMKRGVGFPKKNWKKRANQKLLEFVKQRHNIDCNEGQMERKYNWLILKYRSARQRYRNDIKTLEKVFPLYKELDALFQQETNPSNGTASTDSVEVVAANREDSQDVTPGPSHYVPSKYVHNRYVFSKYDTSRYAQRLCIPGPSQAFTQYCSRLADNSDSNTPRSEPDPPVSPDKSIAGPTETVTENFTESFVPGEYFRDGNDNGEYIPSDTESYTESVADSVAEPVIEPIAEPVADSGYSKKNIRSDDDDESVDLGILIRKRKISDDSNPRMVVLHPDHVEKTNNQHTEGHEIESTSTFYRKESQFESEKNITVLRELEMKGNIKKEEVRYSKIKLVEKMISQGSTKEQIKEILDLID